MLLLSRHWRYHAEYSASQTENNPQFWLESKKEKTNFKKKVIMHPVLYYSQSLLYPFFPKYCSRIVGCTNVELWIAKISAFWLHQSQVPLERPALMTRIWRHLQKSKNCIFKNQNCILRNLTIVFSGSIGHESSPQLPTSIFLQPPPKKSPQKDPEKTPKLPWPCSATGLPL